MACLAASLTGKGVGKSGSPTARLVTAIPLALSSRVLALTANVAEGLNRLRRSANFMARYPFMPDSTGKDDERRKIR